MRLDQQRYEQPTEYKFTMADAFQRRLFLALLRKHGLAPYRYKRQRYTTVMVRCTPRFVDEVLWPQYEQLSETLDAYLSDVTNRVIQDAVHADASEAAVSKELEG
jgi:tRNA nucleotidyltransferase (CCA-adding enzyme)